jgi:uncharacterized protein (TIGR00297 family)
MNNLSIGSELIWGILGSGLIAGAAYKKQSLSKSGAAAAMLVGTILFALGSMAWVVPMIAFFISSSWLTKVKHKSKTHAEDLYEKTGARDAAQVFANGGIAALLCVGAFLYPNPMWWILFLGVMSTVTGDTWATEIGGMSHRPPLSLRTFRKVEPGTSGAVSILGLGASITAGLFIAITVWLVYQEALWSLLLICGLSGFLGTMADSWIGAYAQRMYKCKYCGKQLERSSHCGQAAYHVRGFRFINNDIVNIISSLAGGMAAVVIYRLIDVSV